MSQLFGELQQTENQQLRSENQRLRVENQAAKVIAHRVDPDSGRLMLREASPGLMYVAALIKREKVDGAHQGPKNRH